MKIDELEEKLRAMKPGTEKTIQVGGLRRTSIPEFLLKLNGEFEDRHFGYKAGKFKGYYVFFCNQGTAVG